jgi:hypothetical protein
MDCALQNSRNGQHVGCFVHRALCSFTPAAPLSTTKIKSFGENEPALRVFHDRSFAISAQVSVFACELSRRYSIAVHFCLMTSDAKRQRNARIQSVMDINGTSNNSLHTIFNKLTVDQNVGRKTLTKLRRERYDAVKDTLHVRAAVGEGEIAIPYANPNRLLEYTSSVSDGFRAILEAAFIKHPCSRERPWNLLVGFDEYTPGDKLNILNGRKAMNLIFSFVELGQSVLMLMMQTMCDFRINFKHPESRRCVHASSRSARLRCNCSGEREVLVDPVGPS